MHIYSYNLSPLTCVCVQTILCVFKFVSLKVEQNFQIRFKLEQNLKGKKIRNFVMQNTIIISSAEVLLIVCVCDEQN